MSKSQSRNISPTEHKRIRREHFNKKKIRIGCQFVLINLLGKKVRCGYNEDPSLLDWHHPSPGQKYKHDNGKRLSVAAELLIVYLFLNLPSFSSGATL